MLILGMVARRLLLLRLLLLLLCRGVIMDITLEGGREGRVGMRRTGGSIRPKGGWRGVIGLIKGD